MQKVNYETREQWLRAAVDLIDEKIFEGKLFEDEYGDAKKEYQVGCALLNPRHLGDTVMPPTDEEDVSVEDFYPPTIHINEIMKDPVEILGVLTHELIHGIKGIKSHGKAFREVAKKCGLRAPYTALNMSDEMKQKCQNIVSELGEFPGKAISVKPREVKKRTFSGKIFCPECGYELRISEKMYKTHNQTLPTCPCGAKMALDCEDEQAE